MSQHKDVTTPIVLIFAGIALSRLLPDWGILEKLLLSSQVYIWQIPAIQALTTAILFLVPYYIYQRVSISSHTEEQMTVFKAAIETNKARTRITLDIINEFNVVFDENKHFIKPIQAKKIMGMISDLGDVRIDDEELKSNNITPEERKSFVKHRRELLDRIEAMVPTVEKYLRKIT